MKFKAHIGGDEDEYAIFFSDDNKFMIYVRSYPKPAILDKNGNFPQAIDVEVNA